MNYFYLINSIENGWQKNWEIVYYPLAKITDPSKPKLQSPKLKIYLKLLREGKVFPPIPIDENDQVIDGTHRLIAYQRLKRKEIPVIRPVEAGNGQVIKDEVYQNIQISPPVNDDIPLCWGCGDQLTFYRENESPGPVPGFPLGLPKPPIFVCKYCRLIINHRNFLLWIESQ